MNSQTISDKKLLTAILMAIYAYTQAERAVPSSGYTPRLVPVNHHKTVMDRDVVCAY